MVELLPLKVYPFTFLLYAPGKSIRIVIMVFLDIHQELNRLFFTILNCEGIG